MLEQRNYLKLNDLSSYKVAFHLSNNVWEAVLKWDHLAKDTIGRYTKKDKISFYRYSFGSLKESQDWAEKAKVRKLLSPEEYTSIMGELQKLPLELNSLIKFTNTHLTI